MDGRLSSGIDVFFLSPGLRTGHAPYPGSPGTDVVLEGVPYVYSILSPPVADPLSLPQMQSTFF